MLTGAAFDLPILCLPDIAGDISIRVVDFWISAQEIPKLRATCVAAKQSGGMLTASQKPGQVLRAWTVVGGHECQLVAVLAHLPAPIESFGSSDCQGCRSRLLRWPQGNCAVGLLEDEPNRVVLQDMFLTTNTFRLRECI